MNRIVCRTLLGTACCAGVLGLLCLLVEPVSAVAIFIFARSLIALVEVLRRPF